MLRDALDAFVRRDTDLAQHVLNEDDELDALKTQIFRELLTYMLQDPATIEPALDLILISRHLERIGDHATNIAEDVIFIVSARDVRHHADLQTGIDRPSDSSLPALTSRPARPALVPMKRVTLDVCVRLLPPAARRSAMAAVLQRALPACRIWPAGRTARTESLART